MKKFLRKIISGLVLLIVIIAVGCSRKPITEASSIETSEESILTKEESASTQTETETSEEPPEEETIEEETPEEEIIPEKYFTYKVKYQERHGQGILITDETFPGDLRVTLSDDLPESFFERVDCKTSEECFNEVIEGILDSLQNKEVILRDTQTGTLKSSSIDTAIPIEIVFKYTATKEEEIGYLSLPWDEKHAIPYTSYAFVQTVQGGLRFIAYKSPRALEDVLNIPGQRYGVSGSLNWMATILKFHSEILGWDQIHPTKIESSPEEESFSKKIHLVFEEVLEYDEEQDLYVEKQEYQGILTLKGER